MILFGSVRDGAVTWDYEDPLTAEETPEIAQHPRSTTKVGGVSYPSALGNGVTWVLIRVADDGSHTVLTEWPPAPAVGTTREDKQAVTLHGSLVTLAAYQRWLKTAEEKMGPDNANSGGS